MQFPQSQEPLSVLFTDTSLVSKQCLALAGSFINTGQWFRAECASIWVRAGWQSILLSSLFLPSSFLPSLFSCTFILSLLSFLSYYLLLGSLSFNKFIRPGFTEDTIVIRETQTWGFESSSTAGQWLTTWLLDLGQPKFNVCFWIALAFWPCHCARHLKSSGETDEEMHSDMTSALMDKRQML